MPRGARPVWRSGGLGWAVQRADLVACGVAQVRQIQRAAGAFAQARWVFAGGAAVGNARCVKRVCLLGRFGEKTDGAAVGVAGCLAVHRGGDRKRARGAAVEITVFVGNTGRNTQRAQHGVIKRLGFFEVVGPEHDMAEHMSHLLERPDRADSVKRCTRYPAVRRKAQRHSNRGPRQRGRRPDVKGVCPGAVCRTQQAPQTVGATGPMEACMPYTDAAAAAAAAAAAPELA